MRPSLEALRLPSVDASSTAFSSYPRPLPLIADIWWPAGPLCSLYRPRSGKPSGAFPLGFAAASGAASLPERVAPRAPARPPGGSSDLPRRGPVWKAPGLPLSSAAAGLPRTAGGEQQLPLL